jgi:hypothetical protein
VLYQWKSSDMIRCDTISSHVYANTFVVRRGGGLSVIKVKVKLLREDPEMSRDLDSLLSIVAGTAALLTWPRSSPRNREYEYVQRLRM